METLTISSFPYYSFEDRAKAYTLGSAFYGIYFLVSFPAFIRLDEFPEGQLSLYQTVMDSLVSPPATQPPSQPASHPFIHSSNQTRRR